MFDTLKTFCLRADAAPKAALAAADAAGWLTVSPALVPIPTSPNFSLADYGVRFHQSSGGVEFLVAGSGLAGAEASGGKHPADICMVGRQPFDAAVDGQLSAFATVAPVITQPAQGVSLYLYEDGPTGRRLPPTASIQESLNAGRARMLLSIHPPGKDIGIVGAVRLKPVD